ncbi:cytoplasmic dynein 2 heavy chain 1-like [Danaus plexippus]|uniref:cytoplasmic dynein 2 heavy chain 1-like n=1 Tax=Danaus plexippus TaxID=13037 RepID=UPI002AB03232|nr:cytoplasmic dynein 2 heavy chain 1-like [Danaus plexippus]
MSEAWSEAELIKTGLTTLWTPFEQYNEEYESLAGQKWIVVQRKLHQLDDFVSKWEGVLEPFTSVTLVIKRELDKYSELTIALKYLRGSDFTEKHWREVFGLLGMEYVPVEELTLGRLLAAGQDIKKQMKTLQKINSSASSEAAVRNALIELELWYEGARLTIEYYTDRAKKDTPLVRDYKELIEKVEEQQWVVAGLGGRGQAAGWEGTLADARGLLEAARRAQRRSYLKIDEPVHVQQRMCGRKTGGCWTNGRRERGAMVYDAGTRRKEEAADTVEQMCANDFIANRHK